MFHRICVRLADNGEVEIRREVAQFVPDGQEPIRMPGAQGMRMAHCLAVQNPEECLCIVYEGFPECSESECARVANGISQSGRGCCDGPEAC